MHNKILTLALLLLTTAIGNAQFHTITRETEIDYTKTSYSVDYQCKYKVSKDSADEKQEAIGNCIENPIDTLSSLKCKTYTLSDTVHPYANARGKKPRSPSKDRETYPSPVTKKCNEKKGFGNLPELTIPNLYAEIKKNGIKYPKIVLAQAILETGWFKSSVCRNKNNLFGLTNPRTKTYYEFDHWTESVAAYYSKVQYRYKGGNYLLWLRDIGYAEDKGYIHAIIRVLKQL